MRMKTGWNCIELRKPPIFILIIFLFSSTRITAQGYSEDYSFYRSQRVPVLVGNDTLDMAWTGGMNSVRFSEIDLNLDGVNDLFAFEKHGNRILTFLREGDAYVYAPDYAKRFPTLHDWVILKDFNNDGKPDIFTYGLAGIRVFQNVSDNELSFRLVTDQLQAYYYNGYVNIYSSPDDYLVVDDIDHDGHIDILNFWVLGKYVHHLRNYSDNLDHFDFRLESECWGHFEESADNNIVTLFSDCNSKQNEDEPMRHTGSSMLLHDFDQNGLPDLLLGDVDSPNLILLHNHGTLAEARMTEQDTAFPNHAPVNLYSMPAPSLVHLPNQEHPSLLISPSDPSLTKSQDCNSVWRYDYDNLLQQYTLSGTAFLQEDMIDVGSGCHPVFYDWNKDGLTDLFLSNYGCFDSANVVYGFVESHFSSSIQYFQNIGTSENPVFQLKDSDFGNLKSLNIQALHPTFGDITGDGLSDMLCGQKDGTLILVPHARLESGFGNLTEGFQNIQVDGYSTPTLFDLDNDGYQDLIIGNRRGLLSYYHNEGTQHFVHISDTLGDVDVRDISTSYYGYSVPCFYRDSIRGTVLFCGNENGTIYYYNDIDGHLNDSFGLQQKIWESDNASCQYCGLPIDEGRRSGIAVANLTSPDFPDMIVGNQSGGCCYFSGRASATHGNSINEHIQDDIILYPNPTNGKFTIQLADSEIEDAQLFDLSGRLLLRTHKNQIDMSHLSNGVYFVIINHNTRKKIIKQD